MKKETIEPELRIKIGKNGKVNAAFAGDITRDSAATMIFFMERLKNKLINQWAC